MIPTTAVRRLGTWFVGLFLIAQIFGVVPVLSEHTSHVVETLLTSQGSTSNAHTPHGRHFHDDGDGFIQHHELQDIVGTITCLNGQCEIAFVYVDHADYVPAALVEGDPILLERPPKPMLSA
jgi:hypothetical protein